MHNGLSSRIASLSIRNRLRRTIVVPDATTRHCLFEWPLRKRRPNRWLAAYHYSCCCCTTTLYPPEHKSNRRRNDTFQWPRRAFSDSFTDWTAQLRLWENEMRRTDLDERTWAERLHQCAAAYGPIHAQQISKHDPSSDDAPHLPPDASLPQDMLQFMKQAYEHWKRLRPSFGNSSLLSAVTATSAPPPCAALLHVHAVWNHDGPTAWALLQDWEAHYGGDMELAPTGNDYQSVLRAFAMQDESQQALTVALEIMAHLEQTYPTLSSYSTQAAATSVLPNLYTYQYVIRCIARAFGEEHDRRVDAALSTEELDASDIVLTQHFTLLQSVVDKYIQQLPLPETSLFTDEQFASLVLTISNVLRCYRHYTHHAEDEMMQLRRHELTRWWWRLVQPGNADVWLNLPTDSAGGSTGFSILEQTTQAILEMMQDDLRAQRDVDDVSLGLVESMTQCLCSLDDMMRTSMGAFLPSGRHFHRVIHSWRFLMKHDRHYKYYIIGQQQLSLILQRMEEQHFRNHSLPQSDLEHEYATNSWNALLQAYLDAGVPDKVIEHWNRNKEVKTGRIRRNQDSFTILLLAYAAKRQNDTYPQARERAQQAHSILSKLVAYDPAIRKFEPTAQHFASVMMAWSRSYHHDAALYCQQIFNYMAEESNRRLKYGSVEGGSSQDAAQALLPAETHYRSLIITWGYSKLPEAMQRVVNLYEQMKDSNLGVDVKTLSTVLFALSRTRQLAGAQKAEQILDQMEVEAAVGAKPLVDRSSETSYGPKDEEEGPGKLSAECYKSVMYAWAHCGLADSYEQCSKIFRRLMAAYEKSGWHKDFRPDSATYAILIDSIVSGKNRPSNDIATQAENILLEMESQVAIGRCEPPNVRIYTSVLKAYWKSDQPNSALKVEDLIKRMKDSYESGNAAAKPDNHAMTILIQTWARSDAPNKATIVWEVFKEMQAAYNSGDLGMRPNQYTLCAVLNACAFTNSPDASVKSEALKIALMALNELDRGTDGGLNDFAFRYMFQVIASQIDDITDRTLHAKVIFERCCQAGFLSAFTLNVLKNHIPVLYYGLPHGADRKPVIPPDWTRNITDYDKKGQKN